jgi:hypothetical protein
MLVLRWSVRRTGFVDTVAGLGRSDHICWVFHTPSQFRSSAVQYLSDGLASGQRVLPIADAARDQDLDDVDGFAEARAAGAVQVQDLVIYGSGQAVDAATQVRAYAEATEQTLADGYGGLRVAADGTALGRTPETRAASARYEFLIDRFMPGNPFAALLRLPDLRVEVR